MKKFWITLITAVLFVQTAAWTNSVNLLNDSPYMLKVTIYDANGSLLGDFTMNPRDVTQWSDDWNAGEENQYASQIPYTVTWYCMGGGNYGTCDNVASGSTVTAQSCGGTQECPQQQVQPY